MGAGLAMQRVLLLEVGSSPGGDLSTDRGDVGIALIASLLSVRRAAKVDPIIALRAE